MKINLTLFIGCQIGLFILFLGYGLYGLFYSNFKNILMPRLILMLLLKLLSFNCQILRIHL